MNIDNILKRAESEIGYLEKKNNYYINEKLENAGDKNFTKYSDDLDKINYFNTAKNGYPWCATFVNWLFYKEFGKDIALLMLFQPSKKSLAAGCSEAMTYFKNGKSFYKKPEVGDQIFFTKDGGKTSYHTGIVISYDNNRVYTIEGNTSAGKTIVDNGGEVCKKNYSINNSFIAGYGRPKWELVKNKEKKEDIIKVEEKNFLINGKDKPVNTILYENKNYVEVRGLCEALGANVDYNSQSKKVTINTATETIKIKINGTIKEVSRILVNGENLVKLRDLADDKINIGYLKEENLPTIDTK